MGRFFLWVWFPMVLSLNVLAVGADPDDVSYAAIRPETGTKSMFWNPVYPAARLWRFKNDGDVAAYTTAQSVDGRESAVMMHLPAGGTPGELLIYDVGVQAEDLKKYAGLSFWMKGDGSDGVLSIGTNWNQQNEAYPRVGEFPLKDNQWHKCFVPFEQFTPGLKGNGFYFLNFKLTSASKTEARVIISRLCVYSAQTTEQISAQVQVDPGGLIAAEEFVQRPKDKNVLKGVMSKLANHQPVTIVVAGDSITAGAQLWYRIPEGSKDPSDRVYTNVLASKLAEHYHYPQHRSQTFVWHALDEKTGKTVAGNSVAGFESVSADSTGISGPMKFEGLQVIGVAAPGTGTGFGLAHFDSVLALKPDLVIWAYGANDVLNVTTETYLNNLDQVLRKTQEAHVDLIIAASTPWTGGQPDKPESYLRLSRDFRDSAAKFASDRSLVFVDQFGAFTARGNRYLGDLLSDAIHPNEFGHQILASTLAESLGVANQVVWDRPIFHVHK